MTTYKLAGHSVSLSELSALVDAEGDGAVAHITVAKDPIVKSPTSTATGHTATGHAAPQQHLNPPPFALTSPAGPVGPHFVSPGPKRLLTFLNSPQPATASLGNDAFPMELQRKWALLSSTIKGHSQAGAELLMKQAAATSQLEDLMQHLFLQLKASQEDRMRLSQQLARERAHFAAQAQELQQHCSTVEHRATAMHVVHEAQQGRIQELQRQLDEVLPERSRLQEQVEELASAHAEALELQAKLRSFLEEQAACMTDMRQQLDEQRETAAATTDNNTQLQAQLKAVLQAEKSLTDNLRETHAAIEAQLMALREQVKVERQKRAVVVKKRLELQQQVERLTAQLGAAQQQLEHHQAARPAHPAQQHSQPQREREHPQAQAPSAATPSSSKANNAPTGAGSHKRTNVQLRKSPGTGTGASSIKARASLRPSAAAAAAGGATGAAAGGCALAAPAAGVPQQRQPQPCEWTCSDKLPDTPAAGSPFTPGIQGFDAAPRTAESVGSAAPGSPSFGGACDADPYAWPPTQHCTPVAAPPADAGRHSSPAINTNSRTARVSDPGSGAPSHHQPQAQLHRRTAAHSPEPIGASRRVSGEVRAMRAASPGPHAAGTWLP